MNLSEKIKKVRSGVAKITFYDAGDPVSSGSGFLSRDRLITNSHVVANKSLQDTLVGIRFGDTSETKDDIQMDYKDFIAQVEVESGPNEFDYSVLKIDEIEYKGKYQFDLSDHNEIEEGQEILALGYPFGGQHLTSHFGHVSAIYKHLELEHYTIKLDASINNGNSGGPLLNLATLNVAGIITRKATGLDNDFDSLIISLDKNIQALSRGGAMMKIGGVDPVGSLRATQHQLKILCKNIKRSANTGIGYAFSCENLIKNFPER